MNMTDYRVSAGEAQEDQFTAAIEKCTSQIPSSAYLGAALSSMAISVGFKIAKKDHMALSLGTDSFGNLGPTSNGHQKQSEPCSTMP
jgi:hypothetical protein